MMKPIRKAVIPAAGFGTRFLPATKSIPKEMIPIVDKPVIQYIVEEALQSGIEEILIITGHGKRAIEDHFDTNVELEYDLYQKGKAQMLKLVQDISAINVHYIHQKHIRGLGDAILCAKSFIDNDPFAVLLGDDMMYNNQNPALQQLLQAYDKTGTTIMGCQPMTEEQMMPVDALEGSQCADSGLIRVHNIQELHKAPKGSQNYNCLGRYVFTPDIFEILNRVEPRDDGEIHLHDALRLMLDRQTIYACPIQGKRYDTANKLDYLKATVEYALRRQDLGPSFREYLKEL